MEELIRGKFRCTFSFLKWFRKFFQANKSERVYNPLMARNGQEITHAQPNLQSPQGSKSSANPNTPGKAVCITKRISNCNVVGDLVKE